MEVPSNLYYDTKDVADDIYMFNGSTFIQLGVILGPEYIGTKVLSGGSFFAAGPPTTFSTPEFFLGALGPAPSF